MVADSIALLAIVAVETGAGLNTVRSWLQNPDPNAKFSFKKLAGALIAGIIPALAMINFSTLGDQAVLGNVALFVMLALSGAGTSTVVAASHK